MTENHYNEGKFIKMKKRFKKTAIFAMAAVLTAALAGCGSENISNNSEVSSSDTAVQTQSAQTDEAVKSEDSEVLNFIMPEIGEEIAVMEIKDYGTIKIKLFEEAAPKAVENFKGLAEMNYYDELIFHRIIPDFMNQGGDPRGDGTGGNSMWGGSFDGGIAEGLYHFSGAVAYANSGSTSTNGSQFYIVNTPESFVLGGLTTIEDFDAMGYDIPDEAKQLYLEKGGTPHLDGGYTVFGQVFEGMDVVRKMAEVETDENDKPLTQVIIESVRIVEYEG